MAGDDERRQQLATGIDAIRIRTIDPFAPHTVHDLEAALASAPKAIVAFGEFARDRWLNSYEKLPLVQKGTVVHCPDAQQLHLELDLTTGRTVQVWFAPQPSEHWMFPESVDAHQKRAQWARSARPCRVG